MKKIIIGIVMVLVVVAGVFVAAQSEPTLKSETYVMSVRFENPQTEKVDWSYEK